MADRPITERIITNKALNLGKANEITADIPMGEGYGIFGYMLEIAIALVVGTGTGAKSEGEVIFVPNVSFETDIDKQSHNAAARGLYRVAHFERTKAPAKDAVAAADGTYRIQIPLIFADEGSLNPYECILDTKRYKGSRLVISLGSVADLLTTPGTAAATASLSLTQIRTADRLEEWQKPRYYPYYQQMPVVAAHTALIQAISRQADLRLKRLYWMGCTSPVAGVPFSGTPVDDPITDITIEHGRGFEFNLVRRQDLVEDNTLDFYLRDTRPTGFYCLNFMKDGDIMNGLLTDPDLVSKLNMKWAVDNATAAAIYSIASFAQALKPIPNKR